MRQDRRLIKVEASLTPKQAVVHWLQGVQQYPNAVEYILSQRDQPESTAPMTRLTGQVDQATREAMRGYPKPAIEAAVRRAVKDVVFLVKLQQHVNIKVLNEQHTWGLMVAFLAEMQNRMLTENVLHNVLHHTGMLLNLEMPYPLDEATAYAVKAAIQHHVTTWEDLEANETIQDWVYTYLVNQGATELPQDSYEFRDGKLNPKVTADNEKEVRACFKDEGEFEKFRTGKDYTNGLAGVSDAEYNAHYDQIVDALHKLVNSGQVKEGTVVYLDTVPISFLREAPLIEGAWLDRYMVELATWGALLEAKGYKLESQEDAHPLALVEFVKSDRKEADQTEIQALRGRAKQNLAKFPGRTRKINRRLYLHFSDYCKWRGRKVKGDLSSQVRKGMVTSSWNSWVDAHGGDGEASVAGVPVETLHCYVDERSYQVCPDVDAQLRRRSQLFESLRTWQLKPEQKIGQLQDWKNIAGIFLARIYIFRDAVGFINRHYFDDAQVLFLDSEKWLTDITKETEKVVGMFNGLCTEEREESYRIDMKEVSQSTGKNIAAQTAVLVDMAKAEALDALGEQRAARELAERYL